MEATLWRRGGDRGWKASQGKAVAIRGLWVAILRLRTLNLLITGGNLGKLAVEEQEPPGEVHEPVRTQQADQQAVLAGHEHLGAVKAVAVLQRPTWAVC